MQMKDDILISIIVPIYNAEKFLLRCLDSISNQTYERFEAILVDDGSTDKSKEICDSFVKKDKRFTYLYKENSGVSSARNFGLENANGEYIGFCDADDWMEPDMLEKLLYSAMENDADVAVCSYTYDMNPSKSKENIIDVIDIIGAYRKVFSDYKFGGFIWNKIFRKSVVENLRFNPDIRIYEDTLFSSEAILGSNKICYINSELYHYYYNFDSVTKVKFSSDDSSLVALRQITEKAISIDEYASQFAKKNLITYYAYYMLSLSESNGFSRETYNKLRKEAKTYYSKELLRLAGRNDKIKIVLFLSGSLGFLLLRVMWNYQNNKKKQQISK